MQEDLINKVKNSYKEIIAKEQAGKLENNIYDKISDVNKINIELKRIKKKFDNDLKLFDLYSFRYYRAIELYNDYKIMPNKEKLKKIKQEIISLDILCNIKIGLFTALYEEPAKFYDEDNDNPYLSEKIK